MLAACVPRQPDGSGASSGKTTQQNPPIICSIQWFGKINV